MKTTLDKAARTHATRAVVPVDKGGELVCDSFHLPKGSLAVLRYDMMRHEAVASHRRGDAP
jgi:hypothetical protein